MSINHGDPVIRKLITLGEKYDEIRAVIQTSTRAAPGAHCDIFSDYDPVLYTTDCAPFIRSDEWFEALGPVIVLFRYRCVEIGLPCYTRLVLYEDGTKIDFSIKPVATLKHACDADKLPAYLDVGYEVLLDKDGLTSRLKPPTFKAHIPAVPTRSQYATLVRDFWWDSTYVAKHLWRDDLLPANNMLDLGLKQNLLLRMLEWSIEIDRNWSWRPGLYGKGLKQVLDRDTYDELKATYAGGNLHELWAALFRTTALFSKTAIKVAAALGYEYPHDLDQRVTIYLRTVEGLDRQTTCREDLAKLLRDNYQRSRS